jgi:hypothetical protein
MIERKLVTRLGRAGGGAISVTEVVKRQYRTGS